MPRAGPRKVQRYSLEFKLKAVKLSQLKGVEVQAVADALEIHPFMLSRWRKQARDGVLRGRVSVLKAVKDPASARPEAVPGLEAGACATAGGACPAKKSHPVLFRTKGDVFAFIDLAP